MREMFKKVGHQGWSGRKIYRWLKEIRFVTRHGKPLSLSNIYRLLSTHFYCGSFEYPKDSGNWYKGNYEPLISKSLFDDVQKQLQLQVKVKNKNREFTFTKMFTCGACGSGVTAQEKYKNLKDGSVSKYIYYGCTRSRDINCKEGYIEEKVLLEQLLGIIDQIDLDKSGLKKKLEAEIERHKKFHSSIMGKSKEEYSAKDTDVRNYAKYLLTEGSIFE
jgi:hypothetical protein